MTDKSKLNITFKIFREEYGSNYRNIEIIRNDEVTLEFKTSNDEYLIIFKDKLSYIKSNFDINNYIN